MGLAPPGGSCERRKEPTPWQATLSGDQLRWRDLRVTQKSAAAGLKRANQRESYRDHQYHLLGHHNLRCSEGSWAVRLRLWRSGPGMAIWRQPEGLGSSAPKAGKQSATAKGSQEESWVCRRSKSPLLGWARGGRVGLP